MPSGALSECVRWNHPTKTEVHTHMSAGVRVGRQEGSGSWSCISSNSAASATSRASSSAPSPARIASSVARSAASCDVMKSVSGCRTQALERCQHPRAIAAAAEAGAATKKEELHVYVTRCVLTVQ